MTRTSARFIRILAPALFAASIALGAVACGGGEDDNPVSPAATSNPTLSGTPNPLQVHKPGDTFQDTNGEPFDISTQTAGYVTLVYLGYTFCPDICPTEMAELSAGMAGLDAKTREKIKVLFITVDPERDTAPALRKWLDRFGTNIIGLIPNNQQITRLSRSLGMEPPQRTFVSGSYYTVSHASFILAFTADGSQSYIYPLGTPPSVWTNDLKLLVAGAAPVALAVND